MKCYTTICILILSLHMIDEACAGATREQMEKIAEGFRKTCIGKTGADLSIVSEIRNGNFIENPQAKCYTKCIMGLMKTLTKQGQIDVEVMIRQINVMASADIAPALTDGVKTCYNEVSADEPCELAWRFTKCLHSQNPALFFFP
ncbi:general odorant-binding protein 19a-like [Phymastichus coffea]|uniref:general odorant-binding protein 19a-like n=1 Tax=Phymastichus coffea TaxID=108790 RepID=UPI00273C4755|nr:general odorant-binding protein 19a-like [Phymastichus coffea]